MDESGWELHKENIQPLSSGRNISLMKHSLDNSKSVADYEADIEQEVKDLENRIVTYEGDDPIEPYLNLIRFLEHQCLQTITWKKSLSRARQECYKRFYEDPAYRNDKRYVDAVIKCLTEAMQDPVPRLNMLLTALNKKGIGQEVSQMYLVIADHQESLGKMTEARATLKSGIENKARPLDKIHEAISELEYRICRDLAKEQKQMSSRNFGGSVPVYGEKNDAPVFRNDLRPAPAVMERQTSLGSLQKQNARPAHIFQENEENQSLPVGAGGENTGFGAVEKKLDIKSDKENNLQPSKWNKPDTVFVSESSREYETPRERIPIFTEEVSFPSHSRKIVINEGVLKERKVDSAGDGAKGPALYEGTSFTARTTTSITQPESVPSSACNSFATQSQQFLKVDEPNPAPNVIIKCHREILRSGIEASFEHRMKNIWLRKQREKQTVQALTREKEELEQKLISNERELSHLKEVEASLRDNFESELKQKAVRDAQWEKQRYNYTDTIKRLNIELEEFKEENVQLQLSIRKLESNIGAIEYRHRQEVEDLRNTYEFKLQELSEQLEQALRNSASSNSGTLRQTSQSLEKEKDLSMHRSFAMEHQNPRQRTLPSVSISQSMNMPTDKLLNGTGMGTSGVESFMAPPSGIDMTGMQEYSLSLCDNDDQDKEQVSFNASVRMGGTTTVFGWGGEKTRFGVSPPINFNDSKRNELSHQTSTRKDEPGDESIPDVQAMLPPMNHRKFVLYESMSVPDVKCKSSDINNVLGERKSVPCDFKALSENVPPLQPPKHHGFIAPAPVPVARIPSSRKSIVSARVAEIEALALSQEANTPNKPGSISQLSSVAVRKNSDEVEPPFLSSDEENAMKNFQGYQPPSSLPFDTSNLTCALELAPRPLLNSTPQRDITGYIRGGNREEICGGNYVHTQRIPRFSEALKAIEDDPDRPTSPENYDAYIRHDWGRGGMVGQESGVERSRGRPECNESVMMPNLSPIQEASKESRSGFTTSSSSGSTRGGVTMSGGVSMFSSNSRSASAARSGFITSSRSIRFNNQNQ